MKTKKNTQHTCCIQPHSTTSIQYIFRSYAALCTVNPKWLFTIKKNYSRVANPWGDTAALHAIIRYYRDARRTQFLHVRYGRISVRLNSKRKMALLWDARSLWVPTRFWTIARFLCWSATVVFFRIVLHCSFLRRKHGNRLPRGHDEGVMRRCRDETRGRGIARHELFSFLGLCPRSEIWPKTQRKAVADLTTCHF